MLAAACGLFARMPRCQRLRLLGPPDVADDDAHGAKGWPAACLEELLVGFHAAWGSRLRALEVPSAREAEWSVAALAALSRAAPNLESLTLDLASAPACAASPRAALSALPPGLQSLELWACGGIPVRPGPEALPAAGLQHPYETMHVLVHAAGAGAAATGGPRQASGRKARA